jgi:hypothetical protein
MPITSPSLRATCAIDTPELAIELACSLERIAVQQPIASPRDLDDAIFVQGLALRVLTDALSSSPPPREIGVSPGASSWESLLEAEERSYLPPSGRFAELLAREDEGPTEEDLLLEELAEVAARASAAEKVRNAKVGEQNRAKRGLQPEDLRLLAKVGYVPRQARAEAPSLA